LSRGFAKIIKKNFSEKVLTNSLICDIIIIVKRKAVVVMTIHEKIEQGQKEGWLLTYDEWYAQVADCFELVHNAYDPRELYQEYLNGELR
jgi:hypothetical protein